MLQRALRRCASAATPTRWRSSRVSRRSVKLLNGWNAGHSSMCNKHPPHHPQPAPPAHPIPSVPSHPPARSGQAADHCHRHAGGGAQGHPRLRQVRPHRGRGGAPRDCWQGHDQPASMLFGAWTATGSGVRCPASRNLTQVVLRRARLCAFYPPPLGPAGGQHVSWPAPGPARDRGTHGSSTGGHARGGRGQQQQREAMRRTMPACSCKQLMC